MLACPARRRMLMTRFLMAAMMWGPVPVRAAEASSPKVTSRTQCSYRRRRDWFVRAIRTSSVPVIHLAYVRIKTSTL
jgi:hypothetical protein